MRFFNLFLFLILSQLLIAAPQDSGIDFDIVYVRYPNVNYNGGPYVNIPQGEKAYDIMAGADLMRVAPDGTETVLVDCTTCSVMDPQISFDGTTVYYSKIVDIPVVVTDTKHLGATASYLYKMNISGSAPYTEVQLTGPGSFDHAKYANNTDAADDPMAPVQGVSRHIRDMAPTPLADGRIAFTSNRSASYAFKPGTQLAEGFVQQIYVMDDHDGTKLTPELSNMQRISKSAMHMVQHPIQLKDGRLLYSTWEDVAHRFTYANTELFTMHPDGSNVQQFTEPHDHNKNVNHFITQAGSGEIYTAWYYPSYDYGFGVIVKYDLHNHNGGFLRDSYAQRRPWGTQAKFSRREFDRNNADGIYVITPHTTNTDTPAVESSGEYGTDREGKYSYPSWGKNGHLLVSYSQGYVNWFDSACREIIVKNVEEYGTESPYPTGSKCESLKAGIYLIKNAASSVVTDPTDSAQLAVLHDDPNWNEIFPRAVVPYAEVFGQATPDIIPSVRENSGSHYLAAGEAAAIIGTSSMLNRETDHTYKFKHGSSREAHNGEWRIQGTDVRVYADHEVYGVRIISIPELIYTQTIQVKDTAASKYSPDDRMTYQPRRFGSTHDESWEILGEFPLTNKDITDEQGNPDTSWWAKVPSDTPLLIQAIDINGRTLYSEVAWRSMSPGEERTDCGGCHAHSVNAPPLAFETTAAGTGALIQNISGISDDDPMISNGVWDLTLNRTPLLNESGGVDIISGGSIDIEFSRDIKPIFDAKCNACHTAGQSNGGLVLDDDQTWERLAQSTSSTTYVEPQMSKYIRSPQASASLLMWVVEGARLDGRDNSTFSDDVDYPEAHPVLTMTFEERRTISRWIDLGLPSNFPSSLTLDGFGYDDDNQLPSMHIYSPVRGAAPLNQKIRIGANDSQSGLNWASLSISYYDVSSPATILPITSYERDSGGVIIADMPPLTIGNEYIILVSIADNAGNTETKTSRFTASPNIVKPAQIQNVGVTIL